MTGSLPSDLSQLTALEDFAFGDNLGLCAPTDTGFQRWLAAIPNHHLPPEVTPLGPNCGAATSNDHGTDADGLIEVENLVQLDAIRREPVRDGSPTTNTGIYAN